MTLTKLLYLDSSVYGGAYDPEFAKRTLPLLDLIRDGQYQLAISPIVEQELGPAPAEVLAIFQELRTTASSVLVTEAAEELQRAYLQHRIVGPRHMRDMLHVALATTGNCRAIISWNFRHIVHMDKIRLYNAVNLLLGYNELAIHSPEEVLRYED